MSRSLTDYLGDAESLYRLADKYGDDKLKRMCQDQILASLSADNLIAELAHSFTKLFPALIPEYEKFAIEKWVSDAKINAD